MVVKLQALILSLCSLFLEKIELQKLEPFIASQRGSVSDASATTSAATQAEFGTVCKNEEPRMKQFFKSKKSKRLIAIYADWLED